MSMQEAQAREQAEKPPAPAATSIPSLADGEDEPMLQQAIDASKDVDMDSGDVPMDEDEDEDAAIARAIEMSMQQQPPDDGKDKK